jgi:nicotinamide-nucleotide amidase
MKIEIISTGEEVLSGAVIDSNAAYIAQTLIDSGFEIVRHSCVGDQKESLVRVFQEAEHRADAVIVTGGLGPTDDDRTRESAADAWNLELVFSREAEQSVKSFFMKWNRPIPDSNRKQMMLPMGATCLENKVGTAPGFSMMIGDRSFFFVPGVPSEMRHMLSVHVIPQLCRLAGESREKFMVRTLSHFGIAEADVDYRLSGIETRFPGITLGLRAVFPVIQVKLYARGRDENHMQTLLDSAQSWCLERTGEYLFSRNGQSMEEKVGQLLRGEKKTIALAESCTGGLIAHMLTQVPGSSDYFLFSGVTYSNHAKVSVLGVNEQTLTQHGAVSSDTVMEMARGARAVSGADIALATSGIAGPGGGSAEKPVGTVFIGIASETGCTSHMFQSHFDDREKNKTFFAMKALDLLRRTLTLDGLENGR